MIKIYLKGYRLNLKEKAILFFLSIISLSFVSILLSFIVAIVVASIIKINSNFIALLIASIFLILPVIIIKKYFKKIYFYFYKRLYFDPFINSHEFKMIKKKILKNVLECNDLNSYIKELENKTIGGVKYYGEAKLSDNSVYNFKRTYLDKNEKSNLIYNCSLNVCKNAEINPFKYICKYFNIKEDETNLNILEEILNSYLSIEDGKKLLRKEEEKIFSLIQNKIPLIVVEYSKDEIMQELGFELFFNDIKFSTYTFLYVSAGGNSSLRCDVTLDINNLEDFIRYINDVISHKKSINYQRSLMTKKLRNKILNRDDFTCKICQNSTYNEENLLLEIDHIIPLSKGGFTTEENLQTLCWKCNRKKSSKIYI